MEIIEIEDIYSRELGIYWPGNEFYPAESLDNNSKNKLNETRAARLCFGDMMVNEELFETAYKTLWKTISSTDSPSNLILIEHDAKPKSRIRSFKGIIPKGAAQKSSSIEVELPTGNGLTIIAGVIGLNENNFFDVVSLAGDSRRSFILQQNTNVLTEDFTKWIILNFLERHYLNYLKILSSGFLSDDFRVYKFSGDGGDGSLYIDIFYNQSKRFKLRDSLQKLPRT